MESFTGYGLAQRRSFQLECCTLFGSLVWTRTLERDPFRVGGSRLDVRFRARRLCLQPMGGIARSVDSWTPSGGRYSNLMASGQIDRSCASRREAVEQGIRKIAAQVHAEVSSAPNGLRLLSKGTPHGHSSSISVEWSDDDTLRIRSGSIIDLLVDTSDEVEVDETEALDVITAMTSGQAEEAVQIIGERLIGFSWCIWHAKGERSGVVFLDTPDDTEQPDPDVLVATHRLPPWE